MMETNFSSTACFLLLIFCQLFRASGGLTTLDKAVAREQVLEMFLHGYNSYMTYAYPADELMPLSCTGRVRGQQPSRGDIDDTLGRFSLTLIDSLDTLAVLGLLDEFEDAVHRVVHDVTFDTDIVVSVFETNIRVLGGLLGGHVSAISLRKSHNRMAWYKDELLYMAKDLGYRLLPAFNTTTGVPYPRVNLRHGIGKDRKEKDTCTACAGSMLLEFSALSRLTGDPIFEDKAQHVMHTLWAKRQRSSNLVGTVINIHTGDWVRRDSGVGAGIDSYYEYLLKGYILLGDDGYYERFSTHYDAIMTYINKGPNFIDVHMHRPQSKSRNFMDALFAFWPGLQVLFGDIGPAIKTHEMLYQVTQRHKFLPEAFTPEYDVYWGQHPLRPEFVESTYFLYKATNDPHYLEVGRDVMDSLQKYARVPCGFAGIKDVRTGSHEDRMDSFVLAETFKYLFLLFSEPQDLVLPIDDYLFTTEAHLLPLTLANYKVNSTTTQMASHLSPSKDSPPTNSERSCPSHEFHFPSGKLYSAAVRNSLPSLQSTSCPTSNKETEISNKPSKPRLKASEFVPGNSEHMHQLGKMGIQLVTLDDGRVQLMHSASKAETPADAEEGMKFMQEIIEITKTQQAENVDYHPRVVQIISPDLLRNIVLAAGPAQFGADLDGSKKQAILGSLVQANPFHGCTELVNKDQVQGRIVMAQRGNCMFIEKARILEKLGALGVIITDNNESSSSDTSATFAMSGDGTDDVNIGVVFLFYKEGKILVDALQNNARVDVVVVDKAKSADEINILDIQLQMDERLGIAPVRANVGTPDARYYQQDDGGAAIPSGGPQSEGLQTTLPRQPTDSTSQGGMMPDEVELAGIKLSEGSITADASQDEDAAVIEEGSKQTSKPDKVFVNVDNVQDLLQYAGLEADLYLVNNHQNKLEEGREIYSKVSPQELQLRMEKILFKYMASDKGRTYQQDQQRSKDGGLESTSVGGIVAPEDMDLVLLQIQEEFMKLESIQNAFQKLNPNQEASIPDYSGAVNEVDGVPNSAIIGDEHTGSQSSIEDRTTRHKVGLSSRGEAGGDPAPLSRVELLQKRRDEIREELNRQHKENRRTDETVENKKQEL